MEERRYTKDEILSALRQELFGLDNISELSEEEKDKYYTIAGQVVMALELWDKKGHLTRG